MYSNAYDDIIDFKASRLFKNTKSKHFEDKRLFFLQIRK